MNDIQQTCVFFVCLTREPRRGTHSCIHVDDMIIDGSEEVCRWSQETPSKCVPVKNLGPFTRSTSFIFDRDVGHGLSRALRRHPLTRSSGVLKSIAPRPPQLLSIANSGRRRRTNKAASGEFRQAVCPLVWLATMTRHDLSNAVRDVARLSHSPLKRHWDAVKQILNNSTLTTREPIVLR